MESDQQAETSLLYFRSTVLVGFMPLCLKLLDEAHIVVQKSTSCAEADWFEQEGLCTNHSRQTSFCMVLSLVFILLDVFGDFSYSSSMLIDRGTPLA